MCGVGAGFQTDEYHIHSDGVTSHGARAPAALDGASSHRTTLNAAALATAAETGQVAIASLWLAREERPGAPSACCGPPALELEAPAAGGSARALVARASRSLGGGRKSALLARASAPGLAALIGAADPRVPRQAARHTGTRIHWHGHTAPAHPAAGAGGTRDRGGPAGAVRFTCTPQVASLLRMSPSPPAARAPRMARYLVLFLVLSAAPPTRGPTWRVDSHRASVGTQRPTYQAESGPGLSGYS
jgi:hypothetical protein